MARDEDRRKIRRGLALLLDLMDLEENPDPAKRAEIVAEFNNLNLGCTPGELRDAIRKITGDLF